MNRNTNKSRRIAYYDVDLACVKKRTYSKLEDSRIRDIVGRVREILMGDKYDIIGKYISQGKCECGLHTTTRFIIELGGTKEISVRTIRKVDDSVKGLSVQFESIIARLDNGLVFLDLVIAQVV